MTPTDRQFGLEMCDSGRRHFLAQHSMGIGSLALAYLLNSRTARADVERPELTQRTYDLAPRQPPAEPRAQAMISLFMQGGPSHIDLFDPKPELQKRHGQKFPGKIKYDNAAQASSKILGSPWKFRKHGESGIELSELVPHLASVIDDVTLVRSTRTGVNNHGQSIRAMNSGLTTAGRPSLGSWLTYALGSATQSLPAYMSLIDPGQLPVLGVENWSNGWLPSMYQGTVIRPTEPRIQNLTPPKRLQGAVQDRFLGFLKALNDEHRKRHPAELDLDARSASYDMAARMQISAREAMDLRQETQATQRMYGMDEPATRDYGARCLIARRLVERGVRFIQVFTQNQFWDHHGGIRRALPTACKKVDQPSAALVRDLKQRGLLDSTVVHWGGEMGRLPVIQNDTGASKIGRDHNTHGFTMWLAGGGFRGGYAHGQTDEFGHKAVENIVNHYDYHATLLYLFGIDAKQLSYKYNGMDQTLLAEQDGRVVHELLA